MLWGTTNYVLRIRERKRNRGEREREREREKERERELSMVCGKTRGRIRYIARV